ncbi:hypothetical protein M231_02879 [Tremella mesenterica]|uniref:Ndc10 domain-containing protein n=1 Tax=Tremella mesenterica TaxID=5217 RepID=A0A4Q1BPJ1_TREME|nr:hypothetical protein M231_02879 [Tremella mesenterica]
MPRHAKQNPNLTTSTPYITPQARNAVDGTVDLEQYNLATVTPQLALLFLYEVILTAPRQKNSKSLAIAEEEDDTFEDVDMSSIDSTLAEDPSQYSDETEQQRLVQTQAEIDHLLLSRPGPSSSNRGRAKSILLLIIQALTIILECQLSWSTVHGWVAALVNLWEQQVKRGINNFTSPRSVHTATIISVLRKFTERRKKLLFEDKGKQLFYDGYKDTKQLARSFAHYMERNNEEGLRDALAQALGVYGMLRSDNQRRMLLSDLSSEIALNEGPTACLLVVLVLHSSKTNASGKAEYAAFIRNKDLSVCPVFLLSLYLFARYVFYCGPSPSGFPNLATRANWYDLPLLSDGKNRLKEVSYDTQRRAINEALKAANVHTYQKTHVNRRLGARLAEQGGASPDEIARAGHWAHSVLEIHYLTHIPRKTLRALAGFPVEGKGFFLPRAVTPSPTLLRKIFPDVDKWTALLNSPIHQQQELTGRMFLQTIASLREVFLQDIPHWRKLFPSLYIFNHPLFADEEYKRFEGEALTRTISNEQRYDDRIAQALPILHELLQTQTRAHQQSFQDILSNVLQLNQSQIQNQEQIKAVSDGITLIQTALSRPVIIPGPLQSLLSDMTRDLSNMDVQQSSSSSSSLSAPMYSVPLSSTTLPSSSNSFDPSSFIQLEPFTMSRSVCTVQELWQEYTIGLNGRPSVQSQYENGAHGLKDASETEKRFYRRRMGVIKAVKELMKSREITGSEAAKFLDVHRQGLKNPSLDALQNWLSKASAIDILSV